uniref:ANF_receptor domain-containing protein n=1 Tax=Meloidogyne hapla TaxID=6305 RepID=A0A1I8B9U3_MELHA
MRNFILVSSELIAEIAKKAFNLELNSDNFIYGNQHIAEAILKMLTAFYPFHRFMVFVSQDGGNIARRIDHTDWFKQNDKHVTIYVTTKSNSFLGSTDCYGDISEEFESCYPQKDKILRRIGDICGTDGGYNPESVAVRAVVNADDLGLASSLPKFAMRDEIFTCKNATSPKQRWRVAIALFQD